VPTVSSADAPTADDGKAMVRPVKEEHPGLRIAGAGRRNLELDGAVSVLLTPGADFVGNVVGECGSRVAVADDPDLHDLAAALGVSGKMPRQVGEFALAGHGHRARTEHRFNQASIDRGWVNGQ
jgi:hypothetical protein